MGLSKHWCLNQFLTSILKILVALFIKCGTLDLMNAKLQVCSIGQTSMLLDSLKASEAGTVLMLSKSGSGQMRDDLHTTLRSRMDKRQRVKCNNSPPPPTHTPKH